MTFLRAHAPQWILLQPFMMFALRLSRWRQSHSPSQFAPCRYKGASKWRQIHATRHIYALRAAFSTLFEFILCRGVPSTLSAVQLWPYSVCPFSGSRSVDRLTACWLCNSVRLNTNVVSAGVKCDLKHGNGARGSHVEKAGRWTSRGGK